MSLPGPLFDESLGHVVAALRAAQGDPVLRAGFIEACTVTAHALLGGGRLYAIGNGGSAADAMHVVAELVGRIDRERAPFPAEALVADPVSLSALANDFGYGELFARQIRAKATARDVVVAFSTSGRSGNVLEGLRATRAAGAKSVLFTGAPGTPAASLADATLAVGDLPAKRVQEIHRVLAHAFCESVERSLLEAPAGSGAGGSDE